MADAFESDATREDPEALLARLRASVEGGSRKPGRYEVVGEIARGGMSVVLSVRDQEMRRSLAMKVMTPARPGGGAANESRRSARFLEEAQVTAQLDHPGIVPVHDMGLDPEGRLFFTMRLVKGRALDEVFELLKRGEEGWTRTRALGVVLNVCEAMAFAHERKVVHRDLKPANVMVGRFGETYVMDWGLAKILGEPDTHDVRLRDAPATVLTSARQEEAGGAAAAHLVTLDGDVVGTPAYMPPEQARGAVDEVGPWSDVFSVGALLYHLVTGRAPYTRDDARVPAPVLLLRVRAGPPAPIAKLAPDVPAELVAICEKAMERDPTLRYASMRAMADDLRAFLEHRVVQAYRTGAAAELRKWVQRNRGLAAGLAATLAVVLGALGVVSYVQTRARGSLFEAYSKLRAQAFDLAEANERASSALESAEANAVEARWQSYVANVVAAGASLAVGATGDVAARLAACDPELRDWEWRFLANRADASIARFVASPSAFPETVAWSPDGRFVAAGIAPTTLADEAAHPVRIFDARTHELVHELPGHPGGVHGLAFSRSGSELLSASRPPSRYSAGTAFVWDVASGSRLQEIPRGGGVAWHPDGLHVALCWNALAVWDLLEHELVFEQKDIGANAVAFSEDGGLLAVGTSDGTLALIDFPSGDRRATLDLKLRDSAGAAEDQRGVVALAVFPGDERLAAGLGSGEVAIVDLRTNTVGAVLAGHTRAATSVLVSPDADRIVSSGLDGTIRIWDAPGAELLEVLYGHDGRVTGAALSPDGERVVSSSFDGTLRFWDSLPGSSVTPLRDRSQEGFEDFGLTFDPSGTRLAWRPNTRTVRVSDARSGLDLFALPSTGPRLRGVAFDAGGARLCTISSSCRARIWDATTGELLNVSAERLPSIGYADVSPDFRRFVAYANDSRSVEVRELETGALVRGWPVAARASYARFAHEGARVVAGRADGALQLWDVASGELVARGEMPEEVSDIAVSPDGSALAAVTHGSRDNSVFVWDLERVELLRRLRGHAQPCVLAFAPTGRRLVSGNWDGTLSIWDVERGEVASLAGHADVVRAVAFSSDGERIASAEASGRHRIWDATPASARADARDRAVLERRLEGQVEPLVGRLSKRLILSEDVIAALESDATLSSDERRTAIRLARLRPYSMEMNLRGFLLCVSAEGTPDDYLRALRIAEKYLPLCPDPNEPPHSNALYVLGAAQYRMGRYAEALATLERWRAADPRPELNRYPILPVFLALALARAGRTDEAREMLAECQRLSGVVPALAEQQLVRAPQMRLLKEAERLIEGG